MKALLLLLLLSLLCPGESQILPLQFFQNIGGMMGPATTGAGILIVRDMIMLAYNHIKEYSATKDETIAQMKELFSILRKDGKANPAIEGVLQALEQELALGTADYSAILNITSAFDLNNKDVGWTMKFLSEETLAQFSRSLKIVPIAISGLSFDSGKTWLLKKLTGVQLASGFTAVTQGISFLLGTFHNDYFPMPIQLLWMDTMGKNRPVLGMPAESRVVIDNIVQDYVSKNAQVFLYVTGPVRSVDIFTIEADFQKFMRYATEGKDRTMLVVHNFREYWRDEEVKQHIQNDIVFGFNATKDDCPGNLRTDDVNCGGQAYWTSHNGAMLHFVLANDLSPAAEKYNQKALKGLSQFLSQKPQDITPLDEMVSSISDICNEYLTTDPSLIPFYWDPRPQILDSQGRVRVGTVSYQTMVADFKNTLVDVAKIITEATRRFFTNFLGLSAEGVVDHTQARHPFALSSQILPDVEQDTNKTLVKYYFSSQHPFLDYSKLDENLQLDKLFPLKMDLIDNDDHYLIIMDLPGLQREEVEVKCLAGPKIKIFGRRPVPKYYEQLITKASHLKLSERRFNSFTRETEILPEAYDCPKKGGLPAGDITITNGVLKILVRKDDTDFKLEL